MSKEVSKNMCCEVCGKDTIEWTAQVDEYNNIVAKEDCVFCTNCEKETKAIIKSKYIHALTDKELYEVGLLAISGDMSKHGMSDKSEFIRFDERHINLVETYIYLCNRYLIRRSISNDFWDAMKDKNNAYKNLRDVGVFGHKYHYRTTWMLSSLADAYTASDIEIINRKTFNSRLELDRQYKD